MAIDPYRKSRRIRNVIHWARHLVAFSNNTIYQEQGAVITRYTKRKQIQCLKRLMWAQRSLNQWQGD